MLTHDPRASNAMTTAIGASNPFRYDPRPSHAMKTPIGASKPLRFANTTRTDVFHSPAQQVFCLVIREGFRDLIAICHPQYVNTSSTLLRWHEDSNWSIKSTPFRKCNANRRVSLTCTTSVLPRNL
ncbi:uncharacterized protein G2W53_009916 [Senna tora]|uniref:Uncharacterized protein n=1 Tax=Senna tora TaxID=362788 RepID=A0A834WYS4_9FABA|nr:uncharacterized protein G2W53_009916 [Senna tora]